MNTSELPNEHETEIIQLAVHIMDLLIVHGMDHTDKVAAVLREEGVEPEKFLEALALAEILFD